MGWYEYDSDNGYEYYEPSWYCAVAVGRRTGIYSSQEEAIEQVHGFPGFRMRKFRDYEDAREFLEDFDIYCDSLTDSDEEFEETLEKSDDWFYAVAVGRSTGIFLSFEDAANQIYGYPRSRMEQFLDYDEAVRFVENNQILFDKEEEKTEETKRRSKIWFYAVAVGRSTGVYMNSAEAMEQVHGFSGFQMKKFRNYDEAEEYIAFNQVYSIDEEEHDIQEEKWYYAVAVGRFPGVYTDWEVAKSQVSGFSGFRMKKFRDLDQAHEYIRDNRTYYDDQDEEKSEESEKQCYYAVAVGRCIGIYTDHQDAIDQVYGYSGCRMKRFVDYSQAQEYIDYNQVNFSDEEEKSEDGSQQYKSTWYYAVAVGRSPGIYTDHNDALKQVHGYSGSRMKKFLEYDEAEEY